MRLAAILIVMMVLAGCDAPADARRMAFAANDDGPGISRARTAIYIIAALAVAVLVLAFWLIL